MMPLQRREEDPSSAPSKIPAIRVSTVVVASVAVGMFKPGKPSQAAKHFDTVIDSWIASIWHPSCNLGPVSCPLAPYARPYRLVVLRFQGHLLPMRRPLDCPISGGLAQPLTPPDSISRLEPALVCAACQHVNRLRRKYVSVSHSTTHCLIIELIQGD